MIGQDGKVHLPGPAMVREVEKEADQRKAVNFNDPDQTAEILLNALGGFDRRRADYAARIAAIAKQHEDTTDSGAVVAALLADMRGMLLDAAERDTIIVGALFNIVSRDKRILPADAFMRRARG